MKGWVFLLPTVTKEDAEAYFPEHKVCQVPSGQGELVPVAHGTERALKAASWSGWSCRGSTASGAQVSVANLAVVEAGS